jgi:hypothetical protein
MSEIKEGDTVMVVGSCCSMHLGYVFVVGALETSDYHCARRINGCGGRRKDESVAFIDNVIAHPVRWLKKIPPLSEPVSTQEEATA